MRRCLLPALTVCLALLIASDAIADVFLLRNNGRIEGEWINRDDPYAREYLIRTETGDVAIAKNQVKLRTPAKPALVEYERTAVTYPDTVEGHWKLAEWCREHSLTELSKSHCRRIIELDPNHAQARRRLGFVLEDGEWLTDEERLAKRGLRRIGGKLMTQQEAELNDQLRQHREQELEWFKKIDLLRKSLDKGGEKAAAARAELLAIADPHAVKALITQYNREKKVEIRQLYLMVLGKIATLEALNVLVETSLKDPNEDLRTISLETLNRYKGDLRPKIVALYIAALKSKDNDQVQRGAIGLRYVAGKDRTAVGPLIESLVTEHTYLIMPPGGPGSTSATFDKNGGGGLGGGLMMNQKPRKIKRQIMNHEVLGTLVQLTGVDYAFDKKAWTRWFSSQKRAEDMPDARRD